MSSCRMILIAWFNIFFNFDSSAMGAALAIFERQHQSSHAVALAATKPFNLECKELHYLVPCAHDPELKPNNSQILGVEIVPKKLRNLLYQLSGNRALTPVDELYHDKLVSFYSTAANGPVMDTYFEYFDPLICMEFYEEERALDRFNNTKVIAYLIKELRKDSKNIALILPFKTKQEIRALVHCNVTFIFPDYVDTQRHYYHKHVSEVRDQLLLIPNEDKHFARLIDSSCYEVKVKFVASSNNTLIKLDSLTTIVRNPKFFKYLYPEDTSKYFMKRRMLRFYNTIMEDNQEQVTAIFNIVNKSSKLAPYIIFGPPGTGKTAVLVEAILQVAIPYSKVLVCAPSNTVCDHIAKKVAEFKPDVIIRFIAKGYDETPGVRYTKEVCCTGDAIVTFTTLSNAAHLPHKYDHVFIDEAGQAMECDAIAAISKLEDDGQLVLAGDPKQLAPVCHSKLAENFGLSFSLLERLIETIPIYQKSRGEYNTQYITMLRDNYRCHQQILSLSNRLFYDCLLRAKCPYDPLSEYCLKTSSPKNGGSMIFHAVIGTERRYRGCYSYYNDEEANQVLDYVKLFLDPSFPIPVAVKEIGVVAPYKDHVLLIEKRLKQHGWSKITVGSAEAFQGQGRRIIIVSTVRSERDDGGKPQLGFLKDQRRFNVMLTRASAKCIVIGNPFVLRTDMKWARLIDEAKAESRYINITLKCTNSSKSDNFRKRGNHSKSSMSDNWRERENHTKSSMSDNWRERENHTKSSMSDSWRKRENQTKSSMSDNWRERENHTKSSMSDNWRKRENQTKSLILDSNWRRMEAPTKFSVLKNLLEEETPRVVTSQ